MTRDADFRVDMVGHATIRVRSAGRTLVTDPWLVGPIGRTSAFHFPPLAHDPAEIAAETDAIYVSHVHPDHFDPATLAVFRRDTPIYIGDYRLKTFRDELRTLGFPVIEVPFQEPTWIAGTDFEIAIIEHDYDETAAYDSSIVVRTPGFTLFANNDCFLRPAKYAWTREHFDLDYAFLGYSPASSYPICFELEPAEKARLLEEAADRRYHDFVEAARLLGCRLAVPYASGARFLHESALWKNVAFNSATEAVRRLRAVGLEGAVMGPGDRIEADGSLSRINPVLDKEAELAAIREYARSVEGWVESMRKPHPPPRPDLVPRFRDYILGLWRESRDRLPGVRKHVIAYVLAGAEREQRFYFDFSRPDGDVFQWGEPPRYDMRYTYQAANLQLRLDGEIDWDELHYTDGVSVHQVAYAKDFYRMLRSETLDLG
ncbi:MAG TPA: MBL fold metallo-hydrolase [Candidatus Binatia bacterium]|nr:MBL fold metallo-hydrolase [Candidatus Binatia bacterium]